MSNRNEAHWFQPNKQSYYFFKSAEFNRVNMIQNLQAPETAKSSSTHSHLSQPPARSEWTEQHLTLTGPFDWQRQLEPLVADGTTILHIDLFGSRELIAEMRNQLRRLEIVAPETAVISGSDAFGGLQVRAMRGASSKPLFHAGRVIGNVWEDTDAKYCVLGGVSPTDVLAPRDVQAEEMFEIFQRALEGVGMDFHDVVRTWFYNDRILDWYADFNRVRTAFFKRNEIQRMPASTGVGAANPAGAALVTKAIAVRPKTEAVTVRPVESPLQCDAFSYGSAFSRAMEVATPRSRSIYVSGTASIEPGGATIHIGNTTLQIAKTMEVVDALLAHAGMDIADTTRAIAYFRHSGEMHLWQDYCDARHLPPLPTVVAQCDVCRDDLLFEIELDATRAR